MAEITRYLHEFDTVVEHDAARGGSAYHKPWVAYTVESGDVSYNMTEWELWHEKYFTVEALGDTWGTLSFSVPSEITSAGDVSSVSYSVDEGNTWTTVQPNSSGINITISSAPTNKKVLFKGTATQYGGIYDVDDSPTELYSHFSYTQQYKVYGNIMSLFTPTDFVNASFANNSSYNLTFFFVDELNLVDATNLILGSTVLTEHCYNSMFSRCTSLTTAPALPAETLAYSCYYNMFSGCTSLTTAPELPATTLAYSCYGSMFNGCTALTTSPELPATTLVYYCYSSMFEGCTSLTTAPELPATTLASSCYRYMFNGCTALTTAPATLPATTLANYCYEGMFRGCTSLTTAPVLPATTLASSCYYFMFYGCSSLNYIKAMFTTTPSSTYTELWVSGVAATGTFVKNSAAQWSVIGAKGVPSGWTIQTASS